MPVVWRRFVIFLTSLIPLAFVVYKTVSNQLGADPAKAIVLFTGTWAFYFLLITLAVTPLKRLANQSWLMAHRRMLGLFTVFYASLHLFAYLIFIIGLDFSSFGSELVKRPYILLTIPAIILLIVMGVTSTKGMMRRLGKNWAKLHKSIYMVAVLAWLHVLLQVRSSYADAVLFGVLTAVLLGIRFYWYLRKLKQSAPLKAK